MDKEKIRELAEKLIQVADSGISVLVEYGIPSDFIASIAISPDGYMNVDIQDEPWCVVRCSDEEKARLKIKEEI